MCGRTKAMKPVKARMPMIPDTGDYDDWLLEGNKTLLHHYSGEIIACPVSTAVNIPKHNGNDLIEPIELI